MSPSQQTEHNRANGASPAQERCRIQNLIEIECDRIRRGPSLRRPTDWPDVGMLNATLNCLLIIGADKTSADVPTLTRRYQLLRFYPGDERWTFVASGARYTETQMRDAVASIERLGGRVRILEVQS